jgi:lipid-binding SYLF domain-containing protein
MYNPGEANGMMSSQTRQAIREFQWLNNLPVTGNVDEQTKIAINTQWGGGFESAQLGKTTYSSTNSSSVEREKPAAVTPEPEPTTPEAGISTAEQTQRSDTSAQSKDKTYDTAHDTKVDRDPKSDSKKQASGKVDKEYADRVSKAAAVLQDLTASADKKIPNELLERAEAIAVIPHMMKGAFGIGGRYGKGVVSQRLENGRWSAPAFLEVGGGSFGAQLGVSATDLVLVFTDRKALSMLEGGKDLKLGVDAGVAAGPIGRSAEAGVNLNLESAIYAYSRSKGLFAGVALDGAVLDYDNSANEKVYGSSADAKDILGGRVSANATTRPFLDTLDKVMPKKRISQK